VTFKGALIKSNLPVLERCRIEVSESKAAFVVLHFLDATRLDLPTVSFLIRLQHLIRKKPAELRICSLSADFESVLVDRGAIRREELEKTLSEAVRRFRRQLKC